MVERHLQRDPGDDLVAGNAAAGLALQGGKQPQRGVRAGDRGQRGHRLARLRKQFQDSAGNDAQRAFRADEPLLQVIAGVVLAQAAQPVPEAPVGQRDLEAEHQLAHVAVAQHADAAGIGRDVAADLAGALGAQREREQPVGVARRLLDRLENAAGVRRDGVVDRIEFADPVEPAGRQHDPGKVLIRDRRPDQAGVAALGHHRQAALVAQAQHRRDLFGRARPDDRRRRAGEIAALFFEMRRHPLGRIDPAPRADQVADFRQRRGPPVHRSRIGQFVHGSRPTVADGGMVAAGTAPSPMSPSHLTPSSARRTGRASRSTPRRGIGTWKDIFRNTRLFLDIAILFVICIPANAQSAPASPLPVPSATLRAGNFDRSPGRGVAEKSDRRAADAQGFSLRPASGAGRISPLRG